MEFSLMYHRQFYKFWVLRSQKICKGIHFYYHRGIGVGASPCVRPSASNVVHQETGSRKVTPLPQFPMFPPKEWKLRKFMAGRSLYTSFDLFRDTAIRYMKIQKHVKSYPHNQVETCG